MESSDWSIEPLPIISLDPWIGDDGYNLFRDDGPLGPLPEGLTSLRESDMEFYHLRPHDSATEMLHHGAASITRGFHDKGTPLAEPGPPG